VRVFFDTSAFYALASQTDIHHQAAKAFYIEGFKLIPEQS
jgi:predicted nucleic acid-binding protein